MSEENDGFPNGPIMASFSLPLEDYGCSEEMLTIVSMLSVQMSSTDPRSGRKNPMQPVRSSSSQNPDHLTYLHVYSQMEIKWLFGTRWCTRHFLHPKSLRRAKEIREQLLDIMKMQKMSLISCALIGILSGSVSVPDITTKQQRWKGLESTSIWEQAWLSITPYECSLWTGILPDYVVYHELILTSKEYMSTVTSVDPKWLARAGRGFPIPWKRKDTQHEKKRVTEVEFNRKMEIEATDGRG